jgi:4-oxalocrotonate tautomerase
MLSLTARVNPRRKFFQGEKDMPLIHVKLPEGCFTPAQKQVIMRKFMDAMASIEGDHLRSITCFVVEEVRSGELAAGGMAMTADAVRRSSCKTDGME